MQALEQHSWRYLIDADGGMRLSILMPTLCVDGDTRRGAMLLKNLITDAAVKMRSAGLKPVTVDAWLREVRRVLDDRAFWRDCKAGLAFYIDESGTWFHHDVDELPQVVVAAPRFHILPLISTFEKDGSYYVLALSASQATLFHVAGGQTKSVTIKDAPADLREAMGYDEPQRQLQFHTGAPAHARPEHGARPAMFHGHGAGTDKAQEKDRLKEFCRMLNRGLVRTLAGKDAPLVLAAAEPLLSMFRNLCDYPGLTDQHIEGSPEPINTTWLVGEADTIIRARLAGRQQSVVAAYEEAAETPASSDDPAELVTAAHDARIDTLLTPQDQPLWGMYDPKTRGVDLREVQQSDSEDMNNLMAVMTLRTGGDVHVLPPHRSAGGAGAKAIFRYSNSHKPSAG